MSLKTEILICDTSFINFRMHTESVEISPEFYKGDTSNNALAHCCGLNESSI